MLMLLVIAFKINQAPVASQCTTRHCVDDDNDNRDLVAIVSRLQDAMEREQKQFRDSIELQQKQFQDSIELQLSNCTQLEETVLSLKEDVSKLKDGKHCFVINSCYHALPKPDRFRASSHNMQLGVTSSI